MLFDTLIDSVSGVDWFNTIGIHLTNPSRTRHTFPNNQLGKLLIALLGALTLILTLVV
jgi:hypothetical protein